MRKEPITPIGRFLELFIIVSMLFGLLPLPTMASSAQEYVRPPASPELNAGTTARQFVAAGEDGFRPQAIDLSPQAAWQASRGIAFLTRHAPSPSNPILDTSIHAATRSSLPPTVHTNDVATGRHPETGAAGGIASNLAITTETYLPVILLNVDGLTANFNATPLSGTPPLTVTFGNLSVGDITDYAWSFGDGMNSTAISPTHTYAAIGAYTVALTANGPDGSDTMTRTNYINVVPPAPIAGFYGAPLNGAVALSVAFTNTTTGTVSNYS